MRIAKHAQRRRSNGRPDSISANYRPKRPDRVNEARSRRPHRSARRPGPACWAGLNSRQLRPRRWRRCRRCTPIDQAGGEQQAAAGKSLPGPAQSSDTVEGEQAQAQHRAGHAGGDHRYGLKRSLRRRSKGAGDRTGPGVAAAAGPRVPHHPEAAIRKGQNSERPMLSLNRSF